MKRNYLIDAMIRFSGSILICIMFIIYNFAYGNMTGVLAMTGMMVILIVLAYWTYRLDKRRERALRELHDKLKKD